MGKLLTCLLAVGLTAAGEAAAQGLWFDIGADRPARITCAEDTSSWIEFPPYPFGEWWPLGTLVYAELVREDVAGFDVAYSVRFSDGGCGCGTDLLKPIEFNLHYDETSLRAPEASTTLYRKDGDYWVEVRDTRHDEASDSFRGRYWGFLVGGPTYAVAPSDALRESPSSWGKVKALYRRAP